MSLYNTLEEVQLETVRQNTNAIRWIKNPTPKVLIMLELMKYIVTIT